MSPVSDELKRRAMRPRLKFGRGILSELSSEWGKYVVVTQPPAWDRAKSMLSREPESVLFVKSMERKKVEAAEKRLPDSENIIGIGGGAALDMAKFVGWKRRIEPVLVPGIASVDACVTNAIAVRDKGKVHYIGFVLPRTIICDFKLMSGAPRHFNRAGIGDILSIHTGVFDWGLAAEAGEVEFIKGVARQAEALVDDLEEYAKDIHAVTDEALEFLIRAYAEENALCLKVGHPRSEEGSEHFFAYNVERLTGRNFVHGELVSLGVFLMSRLQDNQHERIKGILDKTGVRYQPRALGLKRKEVEKALLTLPVYVKEEDLFFSVINEKGLNQHILEALLGGLRF